MCDLHTVDLWMNTMKRFPTYTVGFVFLGVNAYKYTSTPGLLAFINNYRYI